LVIEKATTQITLQKDDKLLNTITWNYTNEGSISGIIGIMNYAGMNFLGVISQHTNVGTLNKAKVNKIT